MAASLWSAPAYRQAGHVEAEGVPYFWLSLVFSLCVHAWETYLDYRQHARIAARGHLVPESLRELVTKIEERQGELLAKLEEKGPSAQSYALAKSRFKFVSSSFGLCQAVALALLGAQPWAWDRATAVGTRLFGGEPREIRDSLLFCAAWHLFDTFVSLPFEIYSTFSIEQRYGFNKTTASLFITDKLKTLALTAIIGAPILAGLLALIRAVGPRFLAAYVGGFVLCVSLFFMTIFPIWIQPLFNKYEPLEPGALRTAIEDLARSVSYPLYKIFTVDGSKRSGHSNAYMFGFFKFKRIVIYDTLLTQASHDEIVAILAHELGHWYHFHTLLGFVVTQLYTVAAFATFATVMSHADIYRSFGFAADPAAPDSHTAGAPIMIGLLLFFTTLWEPVDHFLSFLLTLNSRRMEFQADAYATNLRKHDPLQRGLVKITFENLGVLDPDPWYSAYHYSHPPLLERLKAIDTNAAANDKKTL